MRYLLIVNPKSGKGDGLKRVRKIRAYFYRHGMRLRTMFTQYPGQATELASRFGSHYDVVIGAGGDGTINEVINGIVGTGAKLGIMPWGTGNVFAKEMGIYAHPILSSRVIRQNNSISLDLGRMNGRYFLMMAGAGFDAYSLKQLDHLNLKPWIGKMAYVVGGLQAFVKYRYPNVKVVIDNDIKDEGSFVLVSNTSLYGSFFKFNADACPNDGFLDVFVYRKKGSWSIFQLLAHLIGKTLFFHRHAKRESFLEGQSFYRGRHIYLYSEERVLTQLDGELGGYLPVSIDVLPAAVDVILPLGQIKKLQNRHG